MSLQSRVTCAPPCRRRCRSAGCADHHVSITSLLRHYHVIVTSSFCRRYNPGSRVLRLAAVAVVQLAARIITSST
eukprot:663544-Prorocentrum_minimum.AAC.1